MLPIVLRLVVVLLVSSLGACQQQVESPRRAGPAQGSQADEDDRAPVALPLPSGVPPSAEHAGTERAAPAEGPRLGKPCDKTLITWTSTKACEDEWSLTIASCDKACAELFAVDAGLGSQCMLDCVRRSILGL